MDSAKAQRRIGPVDPAKQRALAAAKDATRAVRVQRRVSTAVAELPGATHRRGSGLAVDGLLMDTQRVLFPDGAYDDFDALRCRLAAIKNLEDHGVNGAHLVAAMAVYNDLQAGHVDAIYAWPEMISKLVAAARDACPPPPKDYWNRRRANSSMDEGW